MKVFTATSLVAGIAYALPQSCQTTTKQVIVPTSTATYYSTYVETVQATTAQDLGTFTEILRQSSTKTLQTLTSTEIDCTASGTAASQTTTTIYTSASDANGSFSQSPTASAALGDQDKNLHSRRAADCTVTKTFTTTYGQTYTFVPADATSTYTRFTAFTQATVTSTSTGGTAYAIATAVTTAAGDCGGASGNATSISTTTQDARCAPSALISAAGASETSEQFGLSYSQRTSSGATYSTNTTDASSCCQQCVEAEGCAASAWDVRNGACKLEFPVEFDSGELSCGLGLQAYYNAGPNHPMEPGTGLFVAKVCGSVAFANAKPDDGT